MAVPPSRNDLDGWVCLGLAVLALVLVLASARVAHPEEDAAMLMRYAQNFADGHGIVYNPSGPPVDGATDLLLVPITAVPIWLGLSVDDSFSVVGGGAVIACVCLLYLFARRRGCSVATSAAIALFVLTGKALFYLERAYMAPVFGLAVLVLWMATDRLRRHGVDRSGVVRFVAAALVAGLVRPEGFAFAGLALLSLLISGLPSERRALLRPASWIAGGAVVFVAARWAYFGAPLPNPAYVKAGGALHLDSLKYSVGWTLLLAAPALTVLALGVVLKTTRRLALSQIAPVVLATSMWVLLSNATNSGGRFQYAGASLAFSGAVIVLPDLLTTARSMLERRAPTAWPAACVGVVGLVSLGLGAQGVALVSGFRARPPTAYDAVGDALGRFRGGGRTLLTTEAGTVPLRVGWRSIDAWGLNDAQIAHAGGISQARIAEERPDVIIIHGSGPGRWNAMIAELDTYVRTQRYLVAVPFDGSDPDLIENDWRIYVRPDAGDPDALINALHYELAGQ